MIQATGIAFCDESKTSKEHTEYCQGQQRKNMRPSTLLQHSAEIINLLT